MIFNQNFKTISLYLFILGGSMAHARSFASDNNAGVHPLIMEALSKANTNDVIAYGDDYYTDQAIEVLKKHFGDAHIFFVFNGTAANVLGLKAMTKSYNAIICAQTAHINADECGAPEFFTGCKLLSIPTTDGKLTIDLIKQHMVGFGDQHHVQAKVISITQATELGTVYSIDEIKAITEYAHNNNMLVHMDGARLSNAAASLNVSLRAMTADAGVDVLSFGGTKNGMMLGEAVLFFNKSLAQDFKFIRKQGMQLASKMRFLSCQFKALLSDNLWLENARHANEMAKRLEQAIKKLPQVKIALPVQANAVFAYIPASSIKALQEKYFFYVWDESTHLVRWMTSFATTTEDIDQFIQTLEQSL